MMTTDEKNRVLYELLSNYDASKFFKQRITSLNERAIVLESDDDDVQRQKEKLTEQLTDYLFSKDEINDIMYRVRATAKKTKLLDKNDLQAIFENREHLKVLDAIDEHPTSSHSFRKYIMEYINNETTTDEMIKEIEMSAEKNIYHRIIDQELTDLENDISNDMIEIDDLKKIYNDIQKIRKFVNEKTID